MRRIERLERSSPGPASDEIRAALEAPTDTPAGQVAAWLRKAVPAWVRREETPRCPVRVRPEAIIAALRPAGPADAGTLGEFAYGSLPLYCVPRPTAPIRGSRCTSRGMT